jgi:hypothetical protein
MESRDYKTLVHHLDLIEDQVLDLVAAQHRRGRPDLAASVEEIIANTSELGAEYGEAVQTMLIANMIANLQLREVLVAPDMTRSYAAEQLAVMGKYE